MASFVYDRLVEYLGQLLLVPEDSALGRQSHWWRPGSFVGFCMYMAWRLREGLYDSRQAEWVTRFRDEAQVEQCPGSAEFNQHYLHGWEEVHSLMY